jgi:hypothetical protein
LPDFIDADDEHEVWIEPLQKSFSHCCDLLLFDRCEDSSA